MNNNSTATVRIALAKGRVARKAIKVLEQLGYKFSDYSKDSRKLIFTDDSEKISFFLVKSPDVPVYVEKGTADLGIVGRDILLEHPADVYELLNLNFGYCQMCIAGYPDLDIKFDKKLIVASKYINIAKNYFDSIDQPAEYIYLGGSVELGSRLIANKVSLKTKNDDLLPIITEFEELQKNENN